MIWLRLLFCVAWLVNATGAFAWRIHGGGASPPSFTFSYPPTAVSPDQSVSFTNNFGTFAWSNHQIEDPGGTPHEQYGMWFITLAPAGGTALQINMNGIGAFAMAQDQNGVVYLEQGDANWGPWLAWTYEAGASSPEPVMATPLALDIPTGVGPFTPSSPGTSITAPTGSVTSMSGVWTFTTPNSGADYTVLLNGAHILTGPANAPTYLQATTIEIDSQGNAFLFNTGAGSWNVYAANARFSASGVVAGPIPLGISMNPSMYSANSSCNVLSVTCVGGFSISSGSNVVGHVISTVTPTMSDGSGFAGTLQLLSGAGNWTPTPPFKLVGNSLELNRVLTSADLATNIGGPTTGGVWPTQNGVTAGGWFILSMTVVP